MRRRTHDRKSPGNRAGSRRRGRSSSGLASGRSLAGK